MFVINFKLNLKKILFICFILILAVITIIEFSKTANGTNDTNDVASKSASNYDYILTEENYVETLKNIHENIDLNLGKTIKISGFVFKMPDFNEKYFVCGRNTIINNEDTIAGFLCEHKTASKLIENEWVEITGVIIKGQYNTTMPVIKVGNIKKITAPANTYVKSQN